MGFATKTYNDCGTAPAPNRPRKSRRGSVAVSRKLRLLCDDGLIQKIQKRYHCKVTTKGRPILTAVIVPSNATVKMFIPKAA
jgi:hypothetical protein